MEYILSLSYGKDSLACLGAIEQLSWPLDRIVHAEVWATDTIHADLPPMVEFKDHADRIIQERWGLRWSMSEGGLHTSKHFTGYWEGTSGREKSTDGRSLVGLTVTAT